MYIRILAFLLFLQSFVACQQAPENTPTSAANVAFKPVAVSLQVAEKKPALATDIVFQSADGGQTWQDVSAGLPVDLKVGRVFAGAGDVFLGSESGLYHSSAAPATLVLCRNNPAPAAPVWEETVFLREKITNIFPGQAGPYVASYRKGFFQKIPGTELWRPLHNNLEDKTVRAVLETPDGSLLVGCESGLFKSSDSGKHWKQVFSEGAVNSLTAADNVLICGSFKGLLRSTDGGEHWDWVTTEDGGTYNTQPIEGGFVAITDGGRAWTEVATGGRRSQLRASVDGGKTWQRLDEGLWLVRDIYDIEQAGKYLFCSHEGGISRSSDRGKTWELVRPATGARQMLHLAVSGGVVFAVSVIGC